MTYERWLFVLMFLIILALPVGAVGQDYIKCGRLEGNIGRDTKFDLFNGCLVDVDGQWVPQKNWRDFSGD